MADAESISLEETNKIRISLGLKPLTDDKAPTENKEKEAEDNYAKLRERERKEKETSALAARIAKNRNKQELNRRLVGATLGDADNAVDDTRAWIKRNKKKEKELAAKRQAELDSRDALEEESYTERDLEGLKVSHDFEDLAEGENRILTLKDTRVLDDEEDELQNIDMAEKEKDDKRHELKTKRRDYTGYDDDEFADGANGLKRAVLSKYDEDINGEPEKGFRLGSGVVQSAKKSQKAAHEDAASAVNRSLLSIDYAKNQEISDYAEADKGFKKPKTKKKKSSRRMPADAELGTADEPTAQEAGMQVDEPSTKPPDLDANFIDDEDLQAALSRSRRQKVKRAKISPEEIARRLAEERAEEEVNAQAAENGDTAMNEIKEEDEDGGLTFDDTTEFVRNITYDPTAKLEPKKSEPITITIKTRRSPSAAGDEAIAEMDMDGRDHDSDGEEEGEEAMLGVIEQAIQAQTAGDASRITKEDEEVIGTSSETFRGGLAGTLSILRKQGLVGEADSEALEREKTQKQHDRWLAEYRRQLAMREMERLRSKGAASDQAQQAQREYQNRSREQQDARASADLFKAYKPDVEIKYFDEFGREMDTKEAWKALSHRFHGKGSGRAKTEKRLKKIAEEKKREAMVSGDTPTSMNQAFQKRQEKVGQAHMVLSVGNRGAVPQLEDFLDNATLSKSTKIAKPAKGKKKDAGDQTPIHPIDITSFINSAVQATSLPGSAGGTAPVSAEGSPAPPTKRPAFTRIAAAESAVPTPTDSGSATPLGGVERSKFKIGFGLKRKAGDDGLPPSKR